jgi:hypothetical protein
MFISTAGDVIRIREALGTELSESAVMVAKSLFDGILIPGMYALWLHTEYL